MALSRTASELVEPGGHLQYGDIVLLRCTVDRQFVEATDDTSGFLIADLSGSCPQPVITISAGTISHELPSIQCGTFKILSSNKHDAQNRGTILEEELEDLKKQKNANLSSIKLKELRVSQVKRDVQVETAENDARQKRIQGVSIKYGDKIQLQHTLTGKYVCASITDTSITETTKLKVFLQEKDSIGCIFQIQPHVKVNPGEDVSYADQIKFESVATLGQYLHCSRKSFADVGINIYSNCFELSLSAKESSMKAICYQSVVKKCKSEESLQTRRIVRLFYRKQQCYIVGEGSFVGNCGSLPDTENSRGNLPGSQSIPRSKSLFSLDNLESHQSQVTVDIEPAEAGSTHDPAVPSLETVGGDHSPSLHCDEHHHTSSSLSQQLSCGDEAVTNDVHFRKKIRTQSSNVSSPSGFWQIERIRHPYNGEPVEWSEECRIKHLPTGQYLAVTSSPEHRVTLKSSKLPFISTIFELCSDVPKAQGDITLESRVRVKHKHTGTWLHLDKDKGLEQKELVHSDSSFLTDESTEKSKELYQIIATKEIHSDDIFTFEKVDEEVVKDFYIAASITAVLASQISKCESLGGRPHSPTECRMEAALSALATLKFLGGLLRTKSGSELKNLQKILRSLRTLILVIRLMNLHQNEKGHDPAICSAAIGIVIHFLEGKSTKNKSHVSEMMGHIFTSSVEDTELTDGISVENALIGITKENPKVLFQKVIMTRIIKYVLQTLQKVQKTRTKAVKLLEILSAVCSCKGIPVKQNQTIILEVLHSIYNERQDGQVLYPMRRKPKERTRSRTVGSRPKHRSYEMETVICERNWRKSQFFDIHESEDYENIVQYQEFDRWHDLNKGSEEFLKFFVAQINLLSAMCRGNNVTVIRTLQSSELEFGVQNFGVRINFELIMSASIDHMLRASYPELVAALIELLKVMYVDVGENRPFLEKLPFAFKINELGEIPFESTTTGNEEEAAATALTGVKNKYFTTIRDWIKWFLRNPTEYVFAADEEKQNGVVVKMLQVLTALVKYGYYDDTEDIKVLLPAIHELLDGQDDYPTREIKLYFEDEKPTYHPSDEEDKILGHEMTTLPSAFDDEKKRQYTSKQVNEMKMKLEVYKNSGRFESRHGLQNHFEVKHWAIEILNLLFNFQLYKNLHRFIYDFRLIAAPKSNLKEVTKSNMPQKVKEKLVHLIEKNPRDRKFLKESPRQAKKIIAAAKQRLDSIIAEETKDMDLSHNQELPDALIDLASYEYEHLVQRSLVLLDRYYTSKSDIFQKAIPARLLLTPESVELFDAIERNLFLKLMAFLKPGSNLEEHAVTRGSSVVKELTKYCWLADEVEGYEPHHVNQDIILSFGILPDLVNYILQYCRGPLQLEANTNQKRKLIDCILFLRALACKNYTVQTSLVQYLDDFIKATAGELCFYIGKLLQEIFSGGPSIALTVKAEQICKLLQIMFMKDRTVENTALLSALNELLLIKELDLPLKRNQLIVAKFISQIREDDAYWCKDFLTAEKNEDRHKILTQKNGSESQLVNLLMVADLLATCAIGDNEVIDSICCTMYGEKELISIISSEQIELYRKRPFMKLLVWVHMTVQGSDTEDKCGFYMRNVNLWNHMTKTATIFMLTSEMMSSQLDHHSYLAVKELLSCPTWRYSHGCPLQQHTTDLPQVVTGHGENLEIADLLLYYSEAFLPFLKVFFGDFCQISEQFPITVGTACEKISSALLSMFTPMIDSKRVYFTHEVQVKLYYRVFHLLKHNNLLSEFQLSGIQAALSKATEVFKHELMTQARENYEAAYETEIKLNKDFNQFVVNYKTAYEGMNTRREQVTGIAIHKKNLADKEYSEFLDESSLKPGPRYLPLGRSFQEHVAKFNSLSGSCKRNPKERLLKQLEISFTNGGNVANSERQTELDIKCLQILRALIYNKAILIDEEDKERNPKKYRRDCEKHVFPIQNEIQDLDNTVLRVMPLLSHPNEKIVREVLAFVEAILDFGNTYVQEGLKELVKSQEHQVFSTLKAILNKSSTAFHESELLLDLYKARSILDQKIGIYVDTEKLSTEELQLDKYGASHHKKSLFASFFKTKRLDESTSPNNDNNRSRLPFLAIFQHTNGGDDIEGKCPDDFKFYDLSVVVLISEVLGLMCDGQYKVMQNFLREQTDDSHNVNMVNEMASFLYEFSKNQFLNCETLKVFNELLQALKEFCVGNIENRRVVFNASTMSVINYVLQIDITSINGDTTYLQLANSRPPPDPQLYPKLRRMALELKVSAIELLDVLLEEITIKPSNISQQIAEGLDIPALQESMQDLYTLKDDTDLRLMEFDDNAYRALFGCHRITMFMIDCELAPKNILEPNEDNEAWEYCKEKSRSIEVVHKTEQSDEEVLTRVHFIMDHEYQIDDRLQDKVKLAVDRSTHAAKMRDFREWMDAVKKDTLHRAMLDQNTFTKLLKKFSKGRYWLILLVTLALNILLTVYYRPSDNPICTVSISYQNGTLNEDFKIEYVISAFVLGGLFAFLAVWMLLEYFIVTWPHFVLPKILYDRFRATLRHKKSRLQWIGRLLPKFDRTKISVNIFGIKTIYLLLFLPIAASPVYCFGYLYCAAFFYVIVNNDILQRALQSVTKNWKSLLWVAILLLAVLYCYAVISFIFLRDDISNLADGDLFCERLDECFISVLRFGLIDSFLSIPVRDSNDARARFFYDITFFIIVSTIGLNVVFGIIVDTFSELRDEKFTAERDLKSTCFICNLQSYKFDKKSNNGFENHVKNDHNMWNYIYYSIYLDQIDVTDHNATQKYLYDKISKKSIDFIPFQRAITLKGKGDEDDELKEELEQLQKSVQENFSSINQQLDILGALLRERTGQ